MRIHTDRKQLDGAAVAFVVIILLTIVALEILLSRSNAFFWSQCHGGRRRQTEPIPVGHWNADDQERMGSYFLGVFQIRIWIARVRRTQSAAVLRALLARCWNGGG
jgi:hypothetical protein